MILNEEKKLQEKSIHVPKFYFRGLLDPERLLLLWEKSFVFVFANQKLKMKVGFNSTEHLQHLTFFYIKNR